MSLCSFLQPLISVFPRVGCFLCIYSVCTCSHVPTIRLVYGPSGSGKYSTKGIAQEGNIESTAWTIPLVLYYKLPSNDKFKDKKVAKEWLFESIKLRINTLLGTTFDFETKKLNMIVTVFLDKALAAKPFIGKLENLESLYSAISRVCDFPRLVITGVGIEDCTRALRSNIEVAKY